MSDTMIPGYAYCEAFVYMEETQPGEKAAPPKVTFQDQNGQEVKTGPKNAALNKLTSTMRQFVRWITNKLAQIPALFEKINGAKANYVAKHAQLNQEIANAIQQGTFRPQLNNFPRYKIPLKDIVSKVDGAKNALDEYLRNPDTPLNVEKIKSEIYPGNTDTALAIARMNDPKKEAEAIRNYALFSNITPDPKITSWTGAMTPETWKDMYDDLSNSARLVQDATKAMVKSLDAGMKTLESIRKKEEAEANKPKPTQEAEQPQQQGTNAEQLFKLFQQIAQTYQINVINAITNTFFNTYYYAYRDIVAAYQSQSKTQSNLTEKADAAAQAATNATNNGQPAAAAQTPAPATQTGGV
jgi:hypothetical protein